MVTQLRSKEDWQLRGSNDWCGYSISERGALEEAFKCFQAHHAILQRLREWGVHTLGPSDFVSA